MATPSTANPVRDFAMSPTGGWLVVNGDFAVVAGAEAVPQSVAIGLRTIQGECLLDVSKGVDYIGQVFDKGASPVAVQALLREAVAARPDVTDCQVAQLLQVNSARSATVGYVCDTVYSQEQLIGQVTT